MNYDTAQTLIMEKFLSLHPRETWPDWFIAGATFSGTKDQTNNWIMGFTAIKKQVLPPNEHWENINGRKTLISVDPTTNERRVVLHYSVPNSDILTLFQAKIDAATSEITILVDHDFSSFDATEIEW